MSEAVFQANQDPKLNQKLAESDSAALADFDPPEVNAPIVEGEVAKETPKEEPAAPPVEPPKPKDDLESKLNEIQPRKNTHPNTVKAFDVLKDAAKQERESRKTAEKERDEFKKKLEDLETQYKEKMLTPEMEKDYEELREMRRTFQIERDPEFRAKYDTKLQEVDLRAINILRTEKMSPTVEKFITDNGGVLAMYGSSAQMPRPYESQTQKEWIEETIAGKLSGISKTRFEQALAAGLDLKDEMSREIEQAKVKGSERQIQKQKEIEELFKTSAEATRKSFGKMAEKLEYPENASKEDKTKIDQHNDRVKKAETLFSDYMKSGNNPAKLAEVMARAAHSQMVTEQLLEKESDISERDKKIAALEKKIEDMKKSGSTGRQGAAPAPTSRPENTGKLESDDAALAKF